MTSILSNLIWTQCTQFLCCRVSKLVKLVKRRIAQQLQEGLCIPHNRYVDKFPNFHNDIKDRVTTD